MSSISLAAMRNFLARSMTSLNRNKLHGLLAEIEFRKRINELGLRERVSIGGWIVRTVGPGVFGHHTAVIFPQTIHPQEIYSVGRNFSEPTRGLHTICATFHQIGIRSFFCAPSVNALDDTQAISWSAIQLGVPNTTQYVPLADALSIFPLRKRPYNFLRYKTDVTDVPEASVPEEFSKENIRVFFQSKFFSEISDIDGILWGNELTYPVEIKEKTAAVDRKLGPYFGLDLGPFVKLAFYAAKRGHLHSIFVVREIDTVEKRNLVAWWFITFNRLAQYASWNPVGGGTNMGGGGSTVVKIPRQEFTKLTRESLLDL